MGRHKSKISMSKCILSGDECESAVYVLWGSAAYKDSRKESVLSSGPHLERLLKTLKHLRKLLLC